MSSTPFFSTPNNLERFRKKIIGKRNLPKDINSRIAATGDLEELSGLDVVVNAVRRMMVISDRTYVFDPVFGIGLYKYIFEQCDTRSRENISKIIYEALRRYEDRAKFSVHVDALSNKKGFRIDITIKYEGEEKTISQVYDESLLRTID